MGRLVHRDIPGLTDPHPPHLLPLFCNAIMRHKEAHSNVKKWEASCSSYEQTFCNSFLFVFFLRVHLFWPTKGRTRTLCSATRSTAPSALPLARQRVEKVSLGSVNCPSAFLHAKQSESIGTQPTHHQTLYVLQRTGNLPLKMSANQFKRFPLANVSPTALIPRLPIHWVIHHPVPSKRR